MATTHYIPSNTGWSGSGSNSSAALRFKIDRTYNSVSAQSVMTITLQAKLNASGYMRNYAVQAGSVQIGSGSAVSIVGCNVSLTDYSEWHDVYYNGSVKTWTYTAQHDASGSASVEFKLLAVNLYHADSYIRFASANSATLTLAEPAQQPPTVSAPTASVVDLTGNFPNAYIAGYSKVKVAAAVTKGAGNITAVRLSIPGGTTVNMTYNSSTQKYEGTTAEPIRGNATITVTATDSNGKTGSNAVSVTGVVPYTAPTITIDETGTYRCDSSGVKTDGGTYYRVKATANYYSGLSGNSVQTFTVKIKGSSTETALNSGQQSGAISGMTDAKLRYTIVLTVQDRVSGAVTREYNLNGMMRDLVMKRSSLGTQVGVGTTPTYSSNAPSLIELPSGGIVIIGSIGITDSSTSPGTYLPDTWTAISQSAIPGLYFWLRS